MSDPSPVEQGTCSSSKNSDFDYELYDQVTYTAQSGIVEFVDEDEGLTVGTTTLLTKETTADFTTTTHIAEWFKRPVRIDSYVWKGSDYVGINRTLYPWSKWATEPTVQNKLNNYAFFQGDLHLKFVVNASPFNYGRLMISYLPLPGFKSNTITLDPGTRHFIQYSQRMNVTIDVTENEGATMILPFILPVNALRCASASEWLDMGVLDYISITPLQQANGVSIPEVPITTYAWCDNIKLSGATVAYAAQSGYIAQSDDEYGDGCVSAPASMVAKAATYFESIPIIGRFATATRIGAGAVSAIARLFGFTNVPVIEDTKPHRPEAFPKFASSEIGFPIEKLTLDPKNELSVDPRIAGVKDGTDEMMISNITSRDSYLCQATWSTSNILDDLIFWSRAHPNLWDSYAATGYTSVFTTPLAYPLATFQNWRGDIIFRFKVICTQFHKGRLRISFDPSSDPTRNLSTVVKSINVVHTAIIDIGQTNEVEFRIPYQQASQFLVARDTYTDKGWGVNTPITTYPYNPVYDNGVITVRVLNELTAPTATGSVQVLVYVRGAENFELANPRRIDSANNRSFYFAQSGEIVHSELGHTKSKPDDQYKIYYGENIRSLRQLLRRYEFHSVSSHTALTFADPAVHYCERRIRRMPESPGYYSQGMNTAQTIVAPSSTYKYNFCKMTMLSYYANLYLACRGSTNQSFNVQSPNVTVEDFYAVRTVGSVNSGTSVTAYTTSTVDNTAAYSLRREAGTSGFALTNTRTNAGVNIQFPMYSQLKFLSTDPRAGNIGSSWAGVDEATAIVGFTHKTASNSPSTQFVLYRYIAAGTDFSLMHFLNTPTLQIYNSTPVPP